MSDADAILFANEAFYRAFADRDMDAMEALWAEREDLTCIHPGWPALFGRDKVLQSWLGILANPKAPQVICYAATAHQAGDAAYVICYERIEDQVLIATNYFIREKKRWRVIHHQAGPTSSAPDPDAEGTPAGSIN